MPDPTAQNAWTLTVGTDTYMASGDALTWTMNHHPEYAALITAATVSAWEGYIRQAVQHIEALDAAGWHGSKTVYAQALAFPRVNVPDRTQSAYGLGYIGYYDASTAPLPVQHALCEEALLLLRRGANIAKYGTMELDTAAGVKSMRNSDGSQVEYAGSPSLFGGQLYSKQAWLLLQPLRRTYPSQVIGVW